jgi:rubrerythrin
MAEKEPLWMRKAKLSEGGGERSVLPPTVTGPASLKGFAVTKELRNSINLMLLDEDKGIKEYEVLIARAKNLGMNGIAKTLEDIINDERWHAVWLQEISSKLYGQ